MEVHHPHSEGLPAGQAGKRFRHYLFEFFMLFIAVFSGFLAENFREHLVEHQREKQYIKSFVEDLQADTTDLNKFITTADEYINMGDSLILLLNEPDKNKYANDIYYFFRKIHRSVVFNVNDRTIVQLRNAGGMRLVSNKNVSDSMIAYYKEVDHLKWISDEETDFKRSLRPLFGEILNGNDFGKVIDEKNNVVRSTEPLHLRPASEASINSFVLTLENIKGITISAKLGLQNLKSKAIRIMNFTKKEYHLK